MFAFTNSSRSARLLSSLFVFAIAPMTQSFAGEAGTAGPSWTIKYDFNEGTIGQKVKGLDAGGGTKYSTEQVYEGKQAASLVATRGKENFGRWGGRMHFPAKLTKGAEVWWRVRTYWPKGMDYSANPRLKFLRIHTCKPDGGNRGYNDIYINGPGSKVPFQFIYEGAHKWKPVSGAADAIAYDKWETYEYYVKLDDKSVDDGGQARIRFWKNGKLLARITDRKTLKEPKDYADAALLFTYWNSSPYMGQITYEEGGPFQRGEMVECGQHPGVKFRVEKTAKGAVFLQDPERDWKKRKRPFSLLKPGEKLTGLTSKNTCTVKKVLHSHPLMNIKMYVDDVIVTCKKPEARDAKGNPYIGMGPKRSADKRSTGPRSAREAVLYQDGFESGNMSATNSDGFRWGGNNRTSVVKEKKAVWNNGKKNIPISDGLDWKAKTGAHALRFSYPPGEPWSEQRFNMGKPQKDIWVRYWLRVPKNYAHGSKNPNNGKFFCLWMDRYSGKGNGPTVWWGIWRKGKEDSNIAACYNRGGKTGTLGYKQHKPFISVSDDQGRWMQVVFHIKAATDRTSRDGIMRMWRRWEGESKFTKYTDITDADIAPAPEGPNGWQRGYLLGWMNAEFEERTEFLLDDFTLSTRSLLETKSSIRRLREKAAVKKVWPADPVAIKARFDKQKAAKLYRDAQAADRAGMKDLAKQLYERIVKDFPESDAAARAKTRLQRMQR